MATPKTGISNKSTSNIKEMVLNDLDGGRGSGLPPKRRTRFTYSIPTPSQASTSTTQPSNVPTSRPQTPIRGDNGGMAAAWSMQNRRRALHDSMEDLYRPKNYRHRSSEPPSTSQKDLLGLDGSENSGKETDDCSGSSFTEESYPLMEDSISENDAEEDDILEEEIQGQNSIIDDLKNDLEYQSQNNPIDMGATSLEEKVLLLEENVLLKNRIEEEKKQGLKRKVACGFAFEALRQQKGHVTTLEDKLQRKREEVAARLILHNLLLNSWRLKSGELSSVMNDNAQMHKTIDNLCLQLRVVRHLQTTEKEKSVARISEFEKLTQKLGEIKIENHKIRLELEKVAAERNTLKSSVESLTKDHEKVCSELKALIEKKDVLIRGSELNKVRAEKFQRENTLLKKEVGEVKEQVKSLTSQSSHWQEKSRAFESECWELKLEVGSKERSICDLKKEKQVLQKEREMLALSKSKSEGSMKQAMNKLDKSILEKDMLESKLQQCQSQLDTMTGHVSQLTSSLNRIKHDNKELKKSLYDYSLVNVRRRRVWGKALYFIFNPLEMLKSFYFAEDNSRPTSPNYRGGPGQGQSPFHLHVLSEDEQ